MELFGSSSMPSLDLNEEPESSSGTSEENDASASLTKSTSMEITPTTTDSSFSKKLKKVALIRRGINSDVYKVLHRTDRKLYVLKRFRRRCNDYSIRMDVLKEIQMLQHLDHPNLVKCYDVFEEKNNRVSILLEYMDSGSLQFDEISEEPSLAFLARQLLNGLCYLHSKEIVHGDIKPGNIFVKSRERVKLEYLGKVIGLLRHEPSMPTTAYQSPEQFLGGNGVGRSYKGDIWSLGLTLLQLYQGKFPYGDEFLKMDFKELELRVSQGQPPDAPPKATNEFGNFISCCLQKDITKRWTSEQLLAHPFIMRHASSGNGKEPLLNLFRLPVESLEQTDSCETPPISEPKSSVPRDETTESSRHHRKKGPAKKYRRSMLGRVSSHAEEYEQKEGSYAELRPHVSDSFTLLPLYSCPPFNQDVKSREQTGENKITSNMSSEEAPSESVTPAFDLLGSFNPHILDVNESSESGRSGLVQLSASHVPFVEERICNRPKLGVEGITDVASEAGPHRFVPSACLELQNLPEHLRRCILHCILFPLDYEFDKATLVQLWIAEELISTEAIERLEDKGSEWFETLKSEGYIIPTKFDNFNSQQKYKVNSSKMSSWYVERGGSEGHYLRIDNSKLNGISKIRRHISVHAKEFDPVNFEAIKKSEQLHTLLVFCDCGSSVKQVPDDLFRSLKVLRTLDLSQSHIAELPYSIEDLESLRYLNLSYTRVKSLPESLGCLYNLQTLKLKGCSGLRALPKGMKKLCNLRHLDIDIIRQLNAMPQGMGNLVNLQTLKGFIVGRQHGCSIGELQRMNDITGSFCISKLENIPNAEEAKKAGLVNKRYLNKLELRWGDHQNDNNLLQEEILECLIPPEQLEELQILFYSGSILPKWISDPCFSVLNITLYKCSNCHLLPALGELPALKFLTLVGMDGVKAISSAFCHSTNDSKAFQAFPKLEKLVLDYMPNLETWTGVETRDFPCIVEISVRYCPRLSNLPLLCHLGSLQQLEISHCVGLQSLPERGMPTSLQSLIIRNCPNIQERCLKDGEDWSKIAHVPSIWIDYQEIS